MASETVVSIITPLFNTKPYLKDTFASVLSQSFDNWEWIIVDDCSSDGSFEEAAKLAGDDKRIVLSRNSENKGSSATRNAALSKATGKYITFLDSDDMLDPDYLREQVAFIENHGPIVTASYRRRAPHSVTNYKVPKKITFRKLVGGNAMSCLATMYERQAFPEARFDERKMKQEDYVFWLHLLKTGAVCYGNQKVLATYIIRKGSKNTKKLGLVKYNYSIYRKELGFNPVHSLVCLTRWAFYGFFKNLNVR